jgi:hypothetical protein
MAFGFKAASTFVVTDTGCNVQENKLHEPKAAFDSVANRKGFVTFLELLHLLSDWQSRWKFHTAPCTTLQLRRLLSLAYRQCLSKGTVANRADQVSWEDVRL